jgi:hypothetical protein
MRRFAFSLTVLVLLAGALVPTASAAEAQATFRGAGSARALDVSMPLLGSLPVVSSLPALQVPALGSLPAVDQLVKGLTVGLTSGVFASEPKASGLALGLCGLLPPDFGLPPLPLPPLPALPTLPIGLPDLPCKKEAVETSSAPDGPAGDGLDTCAQHLSLAVLDAMTACANSASKIESGMPVTLNKGGVALLNLDLLDLPSLLGLNVAQTKDQLVDTVTGLIGNILGTVHGLAPVAPVDLKGAVEGLLGQIKTLNITRLAAIQAGQTSTNATTAGSGTSLVAEATGGRIGLLGINNPLDDGLVIIDVSAAKAQATWDSITGSATSSATPAVASVKVKDLLDLVPGDYLTAVVPALGLNNLLAPLAGTILDSSVDLASATPAQSGPNAGASTSGIVLRLLKGLGESAAGARDGGITIRMAAADVAVSGEVVQPVQAAPALPHTGGPTAAFLLGATLLGTGGVTLAGVRRRLRRKWNRNGA